MSGLVPTAAPAFPTLAAISAAADALRVRTEAKLVEARRHARLRQLMAEAMRADFEPSEADVLLLGLDVPGPAARGTPQAQAALPDGLGGLLDRIHAEAREAREEARRSAEACRAVEQHVAGMRADIATLRDGMEALAGRLPSYREATALREGLSSLIEAASVLAGAVPIPPASPQASAIPSAVAEPPRRGRGRPRRAPSTTPTPSPAATKASGDVPLDGADAVPAQGQEVRRRGRRASQSPAPAASPAAPPAVLGSLADLRHGGEVVPFPVRPDPRPGDLGQPMAEPVHKTMADPVHETVPAVSPAPPAAVPEAPEFLRADDRSPGDDGFGGKLDKAVRDTIKTWQANGRWVGLDDFAREIEIELALGNRVEPDRRAAVVHGFLAGTAGPWEYDVAGLKVRKMVEV